MNLAHKHEATTELFLNRELGLLEFNRRVLALAEDINNPLLERLKFLCIVSSNLDEFFEVRVAWVKENIRMHSTRPAPDGLSPEAAFHCISTEAHALVERQYSILRESILPALAEEGIAFLRRIRWNDIQRTWVHDYFKRELAPVLTPIGLDPAHPFPRLLNKSLNFAVELDGRDAFGRSSGIAIVQAPRIFPRFIKLPPEVSGVEHGFVFLSSILHAHVDELFPGMDIKGCYQFRVTRDSDLNVDEEDVKDLRAALQGELTQRQYGDGVRLEVADNCPHHISDYLSEQFGLLREDVYRVDGPVNLVRLMQVPDQVDRPDLKFQPFMPGVPKELRKQPDIFAAIRHGDILLHHPFQSFTPVIDLLQQAARDPAVVAIKMTVYRTSKDSALMEALIEAAEAGKEVTAVVELMARFDEEANINWAAKLERVGAHVVYGVYGYKTHAKMLLIVRREEGRLRRYAHLGTGNYHQRTAKMYTDFGLMTSNEDKCADVNDVFIQLTGMGNPGKLKALWQSPFTMHSSMVAAIDREANIARAGRRAIIIAKMNSLLEPALIEALYAASQAGVTIHLIVRGVCTLRPGVKGLSENIKVRSIVGRLLEHTRVFYFFNDSAEDVYLGSADWMGRNFFRRVEVAFPIYDSKSKRRVIREGLRPYLVDNAQAWEMQPDGRYRKKTTRGGKVRSAQGMLLSELAAKARD
ncbi:polyphosphate kinase 1 [Chitinimonas sp. BJB300]|uniref:polyphosphate kinase 1 n=1 Tax=Chitinimonas sp. BJB300 TaxID=1559339 RepID=UPI000C0F6568|nr:polyphosphate kinase 1 [Chitinimonas sp. BJB300]PHV12730.1 polyphosphate kinase 1 [Chitinimonas sp. BJB300]TSJ90910.1 polyphosphate kinase 1 [Chitinimonas sp. BJB300]